MRAVRYIALASLAVAFAPWLLFLFFMYGPRWETEFERKYQHVEVGMTLEEVRGLLGPETATAKEGDCQINVGGRVVNAVHGEQVFVWEGNANGQLIRVGFDRSRVVSKHYFEYDL